MDEGNEKGKIDYILDTNVLLNDPNSLYAFKENNVLILIDVIRELEKFKSGNEDVNVNARKVLRTISELTDDNQNKGDNCISLSEQGILKIVTGFESSGKPYADDSILKYMEKLSDEDKEKTVIVSEDNPLRIRAWSGNFQTQVYLKQREGGQRVKVSKRLEGFLKLSTSIELDHDLLNEFDKNEEISIPEDMFESEHPLFNNQYLRADRFIVTYKDNRLKKLWTQRAVSIFESISPRNSEQTYLAHLCLEDSIKIGSVLGGAGTGKTIVTLACALEKTVQERKYEKVLIIRPVSHVGNDIGYLPGDIGEKIEPYMGPIYDASAIIFEHNHLKKDKVKTCGLDYMINEGTVILESPTFIRGRNLHNTFVIVDEAQNLTISEVKTLATRIGEGSKIIFTGDPYQIDVPYLDETSNGLTVMTKRLLGKDIFSTVILSKGERSPTSEMAARYL